MICCLVTVCTAAAAQPTPPRVVVTDSGPRTSVAGPGAPAHVIGLQRLMHAITMDTGVRKYGLQYVVCHDKKRPGVAIPGEGYIGMALPSNQNWYAGGFFDLVINGKSIGSTPIHSLSGRRMDNRARVDFVFDTAAAVVRIRFVTLAGNDALYCQVLLEPKTVIKSLRVLLRCYPSAYVTNHTRRVLTPVRDLAHGEPAQLDLAREYWLVYYDKIFDAGYASASRTGVGPCAVLWPGAQTKKVSFTVGGYGTVTAMTLDPQRRDFRFIFFDYAGKKNAAAIADLRQRAPGLLRQLTAFAFTDPSIADWPLAQKQQKIAQVLATMPNEKQTAVRYRKWAAELTRQLQLVQSGAKGAIRAEANAAKLIQQWEQGLPQLKLRKLLNEI
jgi:hypothetical protein